MADTPQPPKPRKKALPRAPLVDGRPNKYTPENRKRILEAIKQGDSLDGAARYAGIDPHTFRRWRVADPEFFTEVEQARSEMKVAMLACIQRAAVVDKQWQAAAWKLERIFPEEFGRRFQPMPMTGEQAQGDAPGKVYRIAIEPIVMPKALNDGSIDGA